MSIRPMSNPSNKSYPPEILARSRKEANEKKTVVVRLPQYVLEQVKAEAEDKGMRPAELLRCITYDRYYS